MLKLKQSDDKTNVDKYRIAANITEYHIMSKLNFLNSKIHDDDAMIVCKNVKNQHIKCRHTDFLIAIIELLRFFIIAILIGHF